MLKAFKAKQSIANTSKPQQIIQTFQEGLLQVYKMIERVFWLVVLKQYHQIFIQEIIKDFLIQQKVFHNL